MNEINTGKKERIVFQNEMTEIELDRTLEEMSKKISSMTAEELATLDKEIFEKADRKKEYRKIFRDLDILNKVRIALREKNTVFEELFSLREGLELLGKDQRTTRELQTIAVKLLQEFGGEVGYNEWIIKVKGRYFIDTVGKEFLRQVFMELENPTTTSFERKLKIALHNFRWDKYIDSSIMLSSSEIFRSHFDKNRSDVTAHMIDELRGLVVLSFGHGHLERVPFTFTERLMQNSRNVYTLSGDKAILLSDRGFARVDYGNELYLDWDSYFSISTVNWVKNQLRRQSTEIFPINALDFSYAADYIEKEMGGRRSEKFSFTYT